MSIHGKMVALPHQTFVQEHGGCTGKGTAQADRHPVFYLWDLTAGILMYVILDARIHHISKTQ